MNCLENVLSKYDFDEDNCFTHMSIQEYVPIDDYPS